MKWGKDLVVAVVVAEEERRFEEAFSILHFD